MWCGAFPEVFSLKSEKSDRISPKKKKNMYRVKRHKMLNLYVQKENAVKMCNKPHNLMREEEEIQDNFEGNSG